MKCPQCDSTQTAKNGHRRDRQCYKCKQCGRQFLESYRPWQYSNDVKQLCIKMDLNGMGLRGTLTSYRHSPHHCHARSFEKLDIKLTMPRSLKKSLK